MKFKTIKFSPMYFPKAIEWMILDENESEVLLISKDSLFCAPYFDCYGTKMEGVSTTLEDQLEKFWKLFRIFERNRLLPFESGRKVKCLTKSEVEHYMPDKSVRLAQYVPYAICEEVDYLNRRRDPDNYLSMESYDIICHMWENGYFSPRGWWLQSSDEDEKNKREHYYVSSMGNIKKDNQMRTHGIRPCIKLPKLLVEALLSKDKSEQPSG